MNLLGRLLLGAVVLYALAWAAYVLKCLAGINLARGHYGGGFIGSDRAIRWLRRRIASS